jgi:hypothetical protein
MIKEHIITPYSLLFNLIRIADLPVSAGVKAPAEMPRSGNEVMSRSVSGKLACRQVYPL